jgi:hypothetical protein
MADPARDALLARLIAENDAARKAFHEAADTGSSAAVIETYDRYLTTSRALLRITNPPRWQAKEIVATWPSEDAQAFTDWMVGYNPAAVLSFESHRRSLPTSLENS